MTKALAMTNKLRPELTLPLPEHIATLPVRRGYPVPWFVEWINGEPEFRVMDPREYAIAVREKRCWTCGIPLGSRIVFPVGPMCCCHLISAEPPSHKACAEWSVVNCPFLSMSKMVRRDGNFPGGFDHFAKPAGDMILRNLGVMALWCTRTYDIIKMPEGPLIYMGDPEWVTFWREGRLATRAEIEESIVTGLPEIEKGIARAPHPESERKRIYGNRDALERWLPAA
jgi:hypothetical protein